MGDDTVLDTDTPNTTGGALVSLADEMLNEPGVQATIKAIARESAFSEAELTDIVLDGWERGLRPLRAISEHVRWEIIVKASNRHAGFEVCNPDPMAVDRRAFALMTPEAMLRAKAIPFGFEDDRTVQVAVYDPTDTLSTDEVTSTLSGYQVRWYVADGEAISAAVSAIMSRDSISDTDEDSDIEAAGSGLLAVEDPADGPIVKLVENIIQQAIALNASDIHLEPGEDGCRLKYRRDGVLIDRGSFSVEKSRSIINRFKTACEMPLDRIRPLDGRMDLTIRGRRYDLRVATCPTVWDLESVVIRLLATQQNLLDLTQLFTPAFLDNYLPLIQQPDGLILVVGRTGDGKPVSVDALVLMADGTRKRLGDIKVGDRVITHEGRPRTVTAVHEQGRLPGVRIETVHGRVTTAALDHPFLTPDGWVEAQELKPGTHLANVVRPTTELSSNRSDAEFVLAGLMVGNGHCTGDNASWTDRTFRNAEPTGDDSVAKVMLAACDDLGFTYRRVEERQDISHYSLTGGVREWLREVGLADNGTLNKRVPDFVYSGSHQQIGLFLGAYLACDGTVATHPRHPQGTHVKGLDCYSVNRDLLADVQHLLLRLGVQSSLSPTNAESGMNSAGEPSQSWRLFIGHENDACARLAATAPIPGPTGTLLAAHAEPRSRFDERLLGDEVAAVTPVASVECRCLTVDEDHTFTVDDLVVHNSTTLAATLNRIARPSVKTCTVEDPVEYKIPGVMQVEVNHKAGREFPVVLKSFLRSDPDIIMVGEIRDQETGDIAVKAAQTGHLVLSTLHIRDVCGTPARLMNMGIEPVMIADTLSGVLSQRLVRRLCDECKRPVDYDLDFLVQHGWKQDMSLDGAAFFEPSPSGCSNCASTGFNGRAAVPELMVVYPEVRDMIAKGEPASRIREVCTKNFGMQTMREAALHYLAAGTTSLDEINRVIQ